MSSLQYHHRTSGHDGVGQGLPLRRGSKLYHVEPRIRYPEVLEPGVSPDQHTYDNAVYHRPPHLPVTFKIGPQIDNHHNGGSNFTRTQYFVLKRGQALMAAQKREPTIGMFNAEGETVAKTYNDPTKWANAQLVGYTNGSMVMYDLNDDADAGDDADARITKETYDGLPSAATAGEPDQTDYTGDAVYTVEEFDALPDEQKIGFTGVEEGGEDGNERIATGGIDRIAQVEDAVLGSTDLSKYVTVDADTFYFGKAIDAQGFIFPSSGGAPRTFFYQQDDADAGVTLPTDGSGESPNWAQPIGAVTDVSQGNAASWVKSAASVKALPTVGLAHTDMENATSHQFHRYSTGTELRSPQRKSTLNIPFVDIEGLQADIEEKTDLTDFSFSDTTGGRSGLKVGLFGGDVGISDQNNYSLLRAGKDGGYGNLYWNFAAPFYTTRGFPEIQSKVVSDLFGNYTHFGAGLIDGDATSNDFNLTNVTAEENSDGNVTANADHVCGQVMNVYDVPNRYLAEMRVNRIFQNRFVNSAESSFLSNGHGRLGESADTAGLKQILADFAFMVLGGSSPEWASQIAPIYGGRPMDIAKIAKQLVEDGRIGMIEIAFDSMMRA